MTPRRQRMSPLTPRSSVEDVSRFARHFGRSPALLGAQAIRACQLYLATEKQLAPASIIVAVAALRFLKSLQEAFDVAERSNFAALREG